MAHFPHRAQDEVYGSDPNTMISAVLAPRGKAVRRADGTWLLNGFWTFGSGCELSKWLLLGAEVFDESGEFLDLADFLIPTSDVEIKDDWYVAGLQGTGSCSLAVEDLEIPEHRYLSLLGLIARETPGMKEGYDGWLHRGEAVPVLALALCGGSISDEYLRLSSEIRRPARRSDSFSSRFRGRSRSHRGRFQDPEPTGRGWCVIRYSFVKQGGGNFPCAISPNTTRRMSCSGRGPVIPTRVSRRSWML